MSPLEEAIIANDALPERERKTNLDLADEFNTSEATVRRRRRALKRRSKADLTRDEFFDLPVGAITKRGKTVRLADGSYEKVEYRPGAVEMEEAKRLSWEDLGPVFAEPYIPPASALAEAREETPIVCLADFQVGKAGRVEVPRTRSGSCAEPCTTLPTIWPGRSAGSASSWPTSGTRPKASGTWPARPRPTT